MRYRIFVAMLVIILVIWMSMGCSNKSNPESSQENPPQLPTPIHLYVPTGAPVNVKTPVQATNNLLNTYYSYFTFAKLVEPRKEGNIWVWTATNQQLTVKVTAEKLSDGSIRWKVYLNGSDGQNTYNNWLFMEGTADAEFKNGNWTVYDFNTQGVAGTLVFHTDGNGNFSAEITSGTEKLDIENNKDNSGSLKIYENNILTLEAQWDANGGGWWKEYDQAGNVTNQGNWS